MSHHLDSPVARQDIRLDLTDLYVFFFSGNGRCMRLVADCQVIWHHEKHAVVFALPRIWGGLAIFSGLVRWVLLCSRLGVRLRLQNHRIEYGRVLRLLRA
ncbi:MAG TPA: hypothetical protein VG322_08755 [Candidatus Acidoferrales bacterium]|jgi:hypothetical protein|nr:hypothetical protein [Candidatus Acidoferrales bacterium]